MAAQGLTPAQRWELEVKGYVVVKDIVSAAHRAELLDTIAAFRQALRDANPEGEGHGTARPNRVRRRADGGFDVVEPPEDGVPWAPGAVAWVADGMPRARNTVYTSYYGTHHAHPAFERYFEDPRVTSIVEELLGQPRALATLESHAPLPRPPARSGS